MGSSPPDGGASVIHMSVTLFGRRRLRSEQGEGLPDVHVENTAEVAQREDLKLDFLLRAEEVLKPRAYVGYFEWLVWSHVQGRPVHILMGDEVLNISAVFGGGLGLDNDMPPICAIAVVWDHPLQRWCVESAGLYSRSNHFLIGLSVPPAPEDYAGRHAQTTP